MPYSDGADITGTIEDLDGGHSRVTPKAAPLRKPRRLEALLPEGHTLIVTRTF